MTKRNGGHIPSLKAKLVLPMLAAALIPMIVFSLMLVQVINRSSRAAGIMEVDRLGKAIAYEIQELESNASAVAQSMSNSPTVRGVYRRLSEGVDIAGELDDYWLLRETVKTNAMLGDFYGIRLFLPKSNMLTNEKSSFFSLDELNPNELPERVLTGGSRLGWSDWREFFNSGWLRNGYMKSYWAISTVKGKHGGEFYVAVDISIDSFQRLMVLHDEIVCEYQLYDKDGGQLLRCGTPVTSQEKSRYRAQTELNDGTLLCIDVDLSQFNSKTDDYLLLLLYISFACTVLIPQATLLILRKHCRDLAELAKANLSVADGEYKCITEAASAWEVLAIQQTYNKMAMRIDDLVHNVYEQTIAKQEAQLNCLFEQIKPHFLYNTLESGKWMAIREGDRRTAVFLEKLARYYRVGLGKGADQVPLLSELEHIRLYVELINMRIACQVSLQITVPPEVLNIPVVRLLLQPLVENSVEHGICAREDRLGIVLIRASYVNREMTITVEDNGTGIPEEKLCALNEGRDVGIGLTTVRKRLELFYREGHSLRFENRCEGGARTTIAFRC